MCKICELRERCDKLRAQKEARQRALAALEEIFLELDKVPELEAEIRAEQEQGSFLDMFTKKPSVTH